MPLILINGSVGIGTGFSTNIPCFNPDDIKSRLLNLVEDIDSEIDELTPWYRGFIGTIEKIDNNKWMSHGIYAVDNYTVTVTELPIGTWIEDYKQFLEKLEEDSIIHTFNNNSTENIIHFVIKVKRDILLTWKRDKSILKNLKLSSHINAQNMHMFNEHNEIIKMSCPEEIIFHFYLIRTEFNKKRKTFLENKLLRELKILESKTRFINEIIDEKLIVFKKLKKDIIKTLTENNYFSLDDDYKYLLSMEIYSFTSEKVTKLQKEYSVKQQEYNTVTNTTISDMWKNDLTLIS